MKWMIVSVVVSMFLFNFSVMGNNGNIDKKKDKKILFVLTSHSKLGDTDKNTGFYLSEAAHPWHVLSPYFNIDFVSPKGGKVPVDGFDLSDPVNKEFWENPTVKRKLNNTLTPSQIDPQNYVAIHFVGGHGTMWDFPQNKKLAEIASRIYDNQGVVSAVCHGPSGLINIRLNDGSYLIKGKKVAGFSNAEEKAAGLTNVVPFLLEDKLKERGAIYTEDARFTEHVAEDGRLITGQNPQSAQKMAEMVLRLLLSD